MNILGIKFDVLPVPIFTLLPRFGVRLSFEPMDDRLCGLLAARPGGSLMLTVNSSHSETRKRFTAAHMLGHAVYHRDLIGKGLSDTRDYRVDAEALPNPRIGICHERQASCVAANILIPKEAVRDLVSQGICTPAELAVIFGVSEGTMRVRLGLQYPRKEAA